MGLRQNLTIKARKISVTARVPISNMSKPVSVSRLLGLVVEFVGVELVVVPQAPLS